jgi:hypothetical protein
MRNVIIIAFFLTPLLASAQCLKGDCSNGVGQYKFENGSIYYGNFKAGQLNGKGTMQYSSGDKYTGNWIDNKKQGGGKFTRKNGNVYEGKFVDNKLNGKGRLIYASEDRYVGTFVESVPNGKGKIYYKNGNLYIGDVVNSKMDGEGRMEYKNGDLYVGGWKSNKKHGDGMFQWASGKSIEATWVEGKRNKSDSSASKADVNRSKLRKKRRPSGPEHVVSVSNNTVKQAQYSYYDGTRYVGEIQNGKPQGNGTVYYASGDLYVGGWRNHMPHGYGVMHFKNGYKYATQWVNGAPGKAENNTLETIEKENYIPVQNSKEVKIFAVVVGVSDYNHMQSLKYTDDDAYQFYAFLKSPEGGAVPDDQIALLIDDAASKKNILSKMQSLFRQADENDVVLMYYSGHGLDGSFVPHDYDGYNNTIAHKDIMTIFDNSQAKHKICIADACYSGSLYASRGMSQDLNNYYQSFEKTKSGTALLLSSKTEEVSLEYSGLRQGVLSHFLIRGLKGEANHNNDQIVSVKELYNYISDNVESYTANKQHPDLIGNFDPNMPIAMVRQ